MAESVATSKAKTGVANTRLNKILIIEIAIILFFI
jgi:hypothetical protein